MDYTLLILLISFTLVSRNLLITKALLTSCCLLVFGFWFVCNMFTGNGVTDAVFYHLFSSSKGTSLDDIKSKIAMVAVFVLIIIFIFIFTYKRKKSLRVSKQSKLFDGLFIITIVLFFTQTVSAKNVITSLKLLSNGNGSTVARFYKKPNPESTQKYNYVFIYAESLERTFRDLDGKNYLPNISLIADNNLDFTDVRQISGTGWTMAGLVNTQCGIPLVLPQGNSAANITNFLHGADCIATAFKKNNYKTLFIRGSDKEFAGGDKFLAQHGWDAVQDKSYFEQHKLVKPEDLSGWGVHDDILMDHAYSEFIRLSDEPNNFLLSFLTVNTHAPAGKFLSECEGLIDYNIKNEMLRSVACSDYLISQFIKKIEGSEYFDKTIIVLVSDHYMMENTASSLLDKHNDDRRNNFIIIKKGVSPQKISKTGSLMDVWPTIIDLSNGKDSDVGFGRSLISEATSPMINEVVENRDVSDYLSFASHLWSYPSIKDAFTYSKGKITIGSQQYKTPMLAIIDDNQNIHEVYFDALASNLATIGAQRKRMLYVDGCKSIDGAGHENACAYILSPEKTEKLIIGNAGVINKWDAETSPIYHGKYVGFSSAPYYVITGNSIPVNNGIASRGVNFYHYDSKVPANTKSASFDTCYGQQISSEEIAELSNNGQSPLIFSSNDSLKCDFPIDSFFRITGIPDTDAIKFKVQVTGVLYKGKAKYIIGEQDKPLDVFIKIDEYSVYNMCNILGDC
ncbi:phosphoglycerol transferase I [Buttiauxella agrestis]|uniref:phosphoglycerol transferase I n=1 Tax=Buttiauxella agrestis TaxID=82977 RepID=UPI00397706A0